MDSHAEIFDKIYANNIWGYGSGPGSIPENTENYRWFLTRFMKSNNIKSVTDVGCGDWQISRLIDWKGINYVGIDVSKVVLENVKHFSAPGIHFKQLNAIQDNLPDAELLILKDVLQHWSIADIKAFIPKISKFKFALITNGSPQSLSHLTNSEIETGQYRPVDLLLPPFELRGSYVFWYIGDEPKSILLVSSFSNFLGSMPP
jgi:SAM-dependent methyltransferase